MYRINLELGEAGSAVFSIVPMRKTLVPRFVQFTQDALDGLGLLGSDGQRLERRRAQAATATDDQQQLQHAHAIAEKERIITDKERLLEEKNVILDRATNRAAKLQADVVRLETDLRAAQRNDDTELPKLMKESTHARKYAKIAFHPDKQPSATTRRIAEPYFKHASAADASRSSGNAQQDIYTLLID